MNGIYYYVIAFILIWTIAIVFKNQLTNHGVEVNFPLLMWKTLEMVYEHRNSNFNWLYDSYGCCIGLFLEDIDGYTYC